MEMDTNGNAISCQKEILANSPSALIWLQTVNTIGEDTHVIPIHCITSVELLIARAARESHELRMIETSRNNGPDRRARVSITNESIRAAHWETIARGHACGRHSDSTYNTEI